MIIVGGRAAGAATAMLLARADCGRLLLERAAFGSDTLSTHALMRGGVLQLSRWRLLDEIVDAGTPADPAAPRSSTATQRVVIDIKPSHGVDALYAPRRTVLDPILVRAAVDAGVDVHFGTSVDRPDVAWPIGGRRPRRDRRRAQRRAAGTTRDRRRRHPVDDRPPRRVPGSRGSAATSAPPRTATGPTSRSTATTWIFRPGRVLGRDPTNDGQVCVFASADTERIGRGGDRSDHRRRRRGRPGHGRAPAGGNASPRHADVESDTTATSAVPTDPGGHWSVMPATTRTRSVPMASPMPSATPSCSPGPWSTASGARPRSSRRSPSYELDARPAEHPAVRRRRPHRQPRVGRRRDRGPAQAAQRGDRRRGRDARRARTGACVMSGRTLLGVWAHPDDEAYLSAGLMADVSAQSRPGGGRSRPRSGNTAPMTRTHGRHNGWRRCAAWSCVAAWPLPGSANSACSVFPMVAAPSTMRRM